MNYIKLFLKHISKSFLKKFSWIFLGISLSQVASSSADLKDIGVSGDIVRDFTLEQTLYKNGIIKGLFENKYWQPDYSEPDKDEKRFKDSQQTIRRALVLVSQKAINKVFDQVKISDFEEIKKIDWDRRRLIASYYLDIFYKTCIYPTFLVLQKDSQISFEQKYKDPLQHSWYQWLSSGVFSCIASYDSFKNEINNSLEQFDVVADFIKKIGQHNFSEGNVSIIKELQYSILLSQEQFKSYVLKSYRGILNTIDQENNIYVNTVKGKLNNIAPFCIPSDSETLKKILSSELERRLVIKNETVPEKNKEYVGIHCYPEEVYKIPSMTLLKLFVAGKFAEINEQYVFPKPIAQVEKVLPFVVYIYYYKDIMNTNSLGTYGPQIFATVDDLKEWVSKKER